MKDLAAINIAYPGDESLVHEKGFYGKFPVPGNLRKLLRRTDPQRIVDQGCAWLAIPHVQRGKTSGIYAHDSAVWKGHRKTGMLRQVLLIRLPLQTPGHTEMKHDGAVRAKEHFERLPPAGDPCDFTSNHFPYITQPGINDLHSLDGPIRDAIPQLDAKGFDFWKFRHLSAHFYMKITTVCILTQQVFVSRKKEEATYKKLIKKLTKNY